MKANKLNYLFVCTILSTLSVWNAQAQISISGDSVSGPTGVPPTNTDPAFWTNGGDANSDGIVGVATDGLLTIGGGSTFDLAHFDLGQQPGATGTVNISGSGSLITIGDHFHIGAHADSASTLNGGNGIVNITSGAVIDVGSDIWLGDSATSTGTVVVDGAGSILRTGDDLWLGDDGTGSLTIQNGGLVEVADVTDVGDDVGGMGTLVVDGSGSIFRSRDLDIGDDGRGQGTITNGGLVEVSDDLHIANDVTGDLSVLTAEGTGTSVTVTDQIRVGEESRGTFNVSDGASVQGGDIFVGGNTAGIGTMVIEGAATTVAAVGDGMDEAGDFTVGGEGQGNVTIRDGARVDAGVVRIGEVSGAEGTITVQGTNSAIVSNDSYLIGFGGNGTLVVENGARAEAGTDFFLGLDPGAVGTVTVQGAGSTLESTDGGINLGSDGGDGNLNVLDGGEVTTFGAVDIGTEAGSNSQVTVNGSGSKLSSEFLAVGIEGNGVLTILDGGQAMTTESIDIGIAAGGDGQASVSGTGSQLSGLSINVAIAGNGALNVLNGGQATASESIAIGIDAGSTGQATVSGTNSQLVGDFISVGDGGNGVLNVLDGGQAETSDSIAIGIAAGSDGQATVSGSNSELTGADINVGRAGKGVLNVQNGGQVTASNFLALGVEATGTGEMNVSGAGSNATGNVVHIGFDGSGTMNVSDSGSVNADVDFSVGTAGTGTLTVVNGGVVNVGNESYIGNDATGVGTATVRGGTWEGTQSLIVGNNGTGTLNVSQGSQINIGRDIAVGSGSGINLMVDGNSILNAGLGGEPGWGDFINNGNVTLIADGALAAGTFTPITIAPSRSFSGSGTFTGVGGTWDNVNNTFTASAITTDGTGDLSAKRVLYEDDLIVGFGDSVGIQSFAVTKLSIDIIANELVLAAYDFDTMITELTSLSFIIGEGLDESLLSIWHQADGATEWTLFETEFYSYTDGIFTFVTDDFSSYAVTVVPEPATGALLLAGLGYAALRRRR